MDIVREYRICQFFEKFGFEVGQDLAEMAVPGFLQNLPKGRVAAHFVQKRLGLAVIIGGLLVVTDLNVSLKLPTKGQDEAILFVDAETFPDQLLLVSPCQQWVEDFLGFLKRG